MRSPELRTEPGPQPGGGGFDQYKEGKRVSAVVQRFALDLLLYFQWDEVLIRCQW